MVARFLRAYGSGAYWNPAHPTRDGIIPWRMFLLLYAQLESLAAMEKLITAEGVGAALSLAMGEGQGPMLEFKKLLRAAYPEGDF